MCCVSKVGFHYNFVGIVLYFNYKKNRLPPKDLGAWAKMYRVNLLVVQSPFYPTNSFSIFDPYNRENDKLYEVEDGQFTTFQNLILKL